MLKLCFVAALLTIGGTASAAVERCEACSPEQMVLAGEIAVKRYAWNEPQHPVYVLNFTDGNVVKMVYQDNVDADFDWERDEFESWGISVDVEPSVRQYVQEMHSVMPPTVLLSRDGSGRSAASAANDSTRP